VRLRDVTSAGPHDATDHTRAANDGVRFAFDAADFDRARRGLIAEHPTGIIEGEFGPAWNTHKYDFIVPDSPAPDTVHPSLWRQAQLNNIHGLFEVATGVWQARGYDISNITFIAGERGWVVIDPLTATATARACLELANAHLGERPVTAVIYTHSHLDHFGGVLGVTTQAAVDAGDVQIIAPEHFMRETVAENLLAGVAMNRRALYQFGPLLPPGPRGHVDCGLGKAVPLALPGLITPTIDITHTGQELVVDGVRIVFQLTPETEAPAEMNFFFPDHGWLCMAENCSHNMHNLVPIRGAQVRDSLAWSRYIDEALHLFGDATEVMFTSHHWPRWGTADVREFLVRQRDLYRWMHDQTLRLANHGHLASEIAEMLELPPEFRTESHTVGYYGSLIHNVKAVYQRYLSWYDGNPTHLHQHPPVESGRRYVELAGGPAALLAAAQRWYDEGDYRWVAELVGHLVFADPGNLAARELQASALEQLGYQSESATFRNAYLMGAQELRHGGPPNREAARRGLVRSLPIDQLFDTLAMRLIADAVGGARALIGFTFTDVDEQWVLELSNRSLHHRSGAPRTSADLTVTTTRDTIASIAAGEITVDAASAAGLLDHVGDLDALRTVIDHLDVFTTGFAIMEP
jgi:alkyl sulfatase BDS1-like metallo-beta-lactamase superfamily hydrolase